MTDESNPNLVLSSGVPTLSPPPMFPSRVCIGGVSIKLNADGSWEGDADAFRAALAEAKQDMSPISMPILWLVSNAIRNRT